MTVSTQTAKSQYTGNGVTTAFTGSFPILDEDHALVILTSTAGVDTTQTISTHYTISGVGGATFTVTFLTAPASGVKVTIARNVPLTQELDLVENDEMPSAELEKSYDKAVMIDQQVNEKVGRALVFPVTDSSSLSGELDNATTRAGKLLRFNATTGEPETVAAAAIDALEFATAADMTAGTVTDEAVSPKELTEWAPAAATLASADELLVRDATDSKIKRMAVLAGITYAMLQNVSATSRVLGRKTAGAGVAEELTLSELLDFIGSAAQGDILYRGASSWARLAAGTSGHFLKTNGAGADPSWAAGGVTTYTSTDQTITSAGSLTLAHGLGATPKGYTAFLVCVTGEAGYSAGDVLVVNPHEQDSAGANSRGTSLTVDATNINVRFGSAAGAFAVLNKGTGAGGTLTNANWSWRIVAWV